MWMDDPVFFPLMRRVCFVGFFLGGGSIFLFKGLICCSLCELEKFLTWGFAFLSGLIERRVISKQIIFPHSEWLSKFLLTWIQLVHSKLIHKQPSDFSKIWRRKERKNPTLKKKNAEKSNKVHTVNMEIYCLNLTPPRSTIEHSRN